MLSWQDNTLFDKKLLWWKVGLGIEKNIYLTCTYISLCSIKPTAGSDLKLRVMWSSDICPEPFSPSRENSERKPGHKH